MIRWIRRIAGVALIAWSAWLLIRETTRRSPDRFGWDEDRPTGIRIAPLDAGDAARARALERELLEARVT